MQNRQIFIFSMFYLICTCFLCACYRLPREDEYSVVPSTNNPEIIREKQPNNFTPNVGF
ncbi:Uncharacterized protein NEOC65_001785 [Neochlamydia sp. AcF65]|nr:Uncharacterized protein [Neochlamydia sp. AcF65]MBS4171518.1 Uncharacterized protein [Neochlamydia sp. AcF95]NGY95036.1 hypothetical protein [Neochlamydia sp. AcF84]